MLCDNTILPSPPKYPLIKCLTSFLSICGNVSIVNDLLGYKPISLNLDAIILDEKFNEYPHFEFSNPPFLVFLIFPVNLNSFAINSKISKSLTAITILLNFSSPTNPSAYINPNIYALDSVSIQSK